MAERPNLRRRLRPKDVTLMDIGLSISRMNCCIVRRVSVNCCCVFVAIVVDTMLIEEGEGRLLLPALSDREAWIRIRDGRREIGC